MQFAGGGLTLSAGVGVLVGVLIGGAATAVGIAVGAGVGLVIGEANDAQRGIHLQRATLVVDGSVERPGIGRPTM